MSYPPLGYAYPSAAASLASTQLLMSAAQANITTSSSSTSCCESGRPIFTDPQTGHTICSCQFTPSLLAYPRVAALSDSYTAAAAAYAAQGYAAAFGADPSAFYSPLNAAAYNELKDNPEAAWRLAQPAACYPYDPAAMAAYSYGGYAGMDLNQARRKNATRETTSTLKAWLYEHRKNPYPTKGEKIMLAIITKMTLTQVSTWFANARRRLKKENKMTWSPRNRCGDEDEDGDGKDGDSDVDDKDLDSDKEDDDLRDLSVHSNDRSTPPPSSPRHTPTPEENSPDKQTHRPATPSSSTPTATKESRKSPSPVKPRIWSLAHVATSGNNDRKSPISTAFPTSPKPGQPYPSAIHTLSHWVDGRYPTHLRLPHPYSFPPIAHTTTTSSLPGGTPSTGASTKIATPLPSSIRYPPALSRLPTSSISDERKSEHSLPSSDKTTSATTAFRPVVKGSFPSAIKT